MKYGAGENMGKVTYLVDKIRENQCLSDKAVWVKVTTCPLCGEHGDHCLNVAGVHWYYCMACGIKWVGNIGLGANWPHETQAQWDVNEVILQSYNAWYH